MEHDLAESLRQRCLSAEWYEIERRLYWPAQWLIIGREDQVAGPGHYFVWEETGVPLLPIRSVDGAFRCFYNSCRHRGAPVVREASGRNRALRCQYHSWTYDTFGRLVSVPDERDFVDLRFEERSLVEVSGKTVSGWILASERPASEPPGLPDLTGLQTLSTERHEVQANWKVLAAALDGPGPIPNLKGSTLAGNAVLYRSDEVAVVASAWPVAVWPGVAGTASLRVSVLAPEWDEDDGPPTETPEWGARLSTVEAWVATVSAIASACQAELAGGVVPELLARDAARHAAIDRAIGPGHVPAAWRVAT